MLQNDSHNYYSAKQWKCKTITQFTVTINYSNLMKVILGLYVSDVQCFSFQCTFEKDYY